MTLENLFVKKYEKLEQEKIELEKKVKGLEIDLSQKDQLLNEIGEWLKKGYPKLSSKNYLSLSIFERLDEKTEKMLEKLGIKLEEE